MLDPTYTFPSRQTLKKMVEEKYKDAKEKAKEDVKKARAEWGIQNEVRCLVTDAAANMIACASRLKMHHTNCLAHALNLVVKKAIEQTPGLEDIRVKARKIVAHFKSSTTAREKLLLLQNQMGKPNHKLIQEVDTRWNSTYAMLERLFAQKEPVGAAMISLKTNLTPLTSEEYQTVNECLGVMCYFNEASTELSEEKRVSGSKVIPLIRMLRHAITSKTSQVHDDTALQLCNNLLRLISERMSTYETMSVMTLATLLDPRFKTIGFCSQSNAQTAVRRLTAECAAMIRAAENTPSTSSQIPSLQSETSGATGSDAINSGTFWYI
ncbi:hypothetical protein M9458_052807 [Cirrhinus mrigala]|uniref:Zinc finger BED domain-containing protein 4 n=1 Tax=Cirrhinus mrigala TaxID=683832 RepID=A0ABD0MSY1_CIRMR